MAILGKLTSKNDYAQKIEDDCVITCGKKNIQVRQIRCN